jgi:hypothetical protein
MQLVVIAVAERVDEVKKIRDVSIAMRAYARQANNHELEADAIEIRMRATRRMDQMRQEQAATIGLSKGTRGSKVGFITSRRWQVGPVRRAFSLSPTAFPIWNIFASQFAVRRWSWVKF